MANVTVTEAAGFIPEIWAASALGYLRANTVMARLVNRDYENSIQNAGDVIHIPRRGALTVNAKVANTVVTLQTPSADTVDVTLNHHEEVSFLVEDVAKAQANQSIIDGYIQDAMQVMAENLDSDILAFYSGFSTTPIDATTGSGGVTAATVTAARRALNNARVPQTNRYIVWHPDAESELLEEEKFTSSDFGDNGDAIREAIIGRKYGFTHLVDPLVAEVSGEAKNLAFHRDALALVTRPLPVIPEGLGARASNMEEDGVTIRVIYSYNPAYLGVQVTLDMLYGIAELRDNHAVVIRSTLL